MCIKPHGNHIPKIYNTEKIKESKHNTRGTVVIKSQGKRTKEEIGKKEQPPNNEQNGNKYILINNYFKWTKCFNQRKEWPNGYKDKTHVCAAYKTLTSDLKTYRLKAKGWKKVFHANGNQKNAGVAILTRQNRLKQRL